MTATHPVPELRAEADGDISLAGAVTLRTVGALYSAHPNPGQGTGARMDLAEVAHIDSAGLALLVEWRAAAERGGSTLTFHNAPAALVSLASVAGLADVFS